MDGGNVMQERPNPSDRLWLPENAATRRQLLSKAAKLGVIAPLSMSALLAACGDDDDGGGTAANSSSGESGNSAEGATIGISWPFRSVAFYGAYQQAWKEEAEKAGVKVLEPQAETEAPAQVEEINAWIERGVDAILIGPVDDASVAPAVKRANAAKIPVITYRSPLEGIAGGMYYDDEAGGYAVGENAANWINEKFDGSAEVALLTFLEQETTRVRIDQATKAIKEKATGDVKFFDAKGLLAADALSATENLLSAHPNIRVIICTADDGCLGARPAYVNSGLPREDVYIAGWDGSEPVLKFIKDNDDLIRATGALPLEDLARDMVRIPVRVLEGEKQPVEVVHPYTVVTTDTPDEIEKFMRVYQ
jgi:ABC-type sugar transport system substrate-binding protein